MFSNYRPTKIACWIENNEPPARRRPPTQQDIVSAELQFLKECTNNLNKDMLIVYNFKKAGFARFLLEFCKNFVPVSLESVCAERMGGFEQFHSSLVRFTKHCPANTSFQKGIYKSDFNQVQKPQGETATNGF